MERMIPIIGLPGVIGDFSISSVTTNYNISSSDIMPYNPATLAESRHAFETSPEYRQSLKDEARFHLVNTWLLDGRVQIVNPEAFEKSYPVDDSESVNCRAIGGKKNRIELPRIVDESRNWVTEYDRHTGWPSRLGTKKEAEKVFGKDASRFWYRCSDGLRAVFVGPHWNLDDSGPFDVDARYVCVKDPDIGVRSVSRHSNGESRRVIEVSEEEYKQYLEWRESQQRSQ